MKKIILVFVVIFSMGIISSSCNSQKKVILTEAYQCPMKCEGDKTYSDKEVKCPVCNMSLTELKHN